MARNIQKNMTISKQKFKGGWIKEIIKRSDGRKQDVYVYSPSGTKLRSSKALLEFIRENKTYLKNLDPTEVNFHQQPGKTGASTSKFIQDIEILKLDYGLTEEDNGNNNPLLDAKSESYTGISTKDEVIKRHGVLTESIRTNVQLDESSSNIIYLMCDFERMDFEKVEDGDSGFFMREKSSNNEAFVEEIDEDITFYHFHHL